MTCRDVTAFLMAYLGGELPQQVHDTFDRHLAHCAVCRQFLHQYRSTIALSSALCDKDEMPFPDDLVAAIKASIAKES